MIQTTDSGVGETPVEAPTNVRVVQLSDLEFKRYFPPRFDNSVGREDNGFADIEFTVTAEGRTADIIVLDSTTMRDRGVRRAESAVQKWRFVPISEPARTGVRLRYQSQQ